MNFHDLTKKLKGNIVNPGSNVGERQPEEKKQEDQVDSYSWKNASWDTNNPLEEALNKSDDHSGPKEDEKIPNK
ncbi:hypothetical protein ABK040_009410 [Willaertia magna]